MGERVLITGASNGIGLELAKKFASEGYDLLLVARSEDKLNSLSRELEEGFGIEALVYPMDLVKKDASLDILKFTKDRGIDIDILVNNAGFGDFGPFLESDWDKQYDMVELNISALMHLTRLFAPEMVKKGRGYILNIASLGAFQAGPLMSVYYASKAFVLSFTEALSVELKGKGIAITAVCPGPVHTGFRDEAGLQSSGLFRNLQVADAKDIAKYSYKKLMRKRVVAVPGFLNKLAQIGTKFAPRFLVRRVVFKIQK